jgi:hypothetical protein
MWSSGGGGGEIMAGESGGITPDRPIDEWWQIGTGNPLQWYWCGGNGYLRVDVTDSQGGFISAQKYIQGAGGGGGGGIEAMVNASGHGELTAKILPTEFSLGSYPNPFNPSCAISYQLPVDGFVYLSVFDVLGREIATLVNAEKRAGLYTEVFDGSDVQSGVYLARISVMPEEGNDFVHTIKLVLTK